MVLDSSRSNIVVRDFTNENYIESFMNVYVKSLFMILQEIHHVFE